MSTTRRITLTAVFAALAFAAMFVFRFNVTFLTFDLKDAVITISGLLLGPLAAFTVSLLVATLEFITVGDTGWYGFVMNFASSATFSVVCATVYSYKKTLAGAAMGLLSAVVALVGVMLSLNLLITPFYQGVSRSVVMDMIPTLFLPFNAVKGAVNAGIVLILYKPVHQAMQAAKVMPLPSGESEADGCGKKRRVCRSLCVLVAGLILLILAILIFSMILHGEFTLFGEFTWFQNLVSGSGANS